MTEHKTYKWQWWWAQKPFFKFLEVTLGCSIVPFLYATVITALRKQNIISMKQCQKPRSKIIRHKTCRTLWLLSSGNIGSWAFDKSGPSFPLEACLSKDPSGPPISQASYTQGHQRGYQDCRHRCWRWTRCPGGVSEEKQVKDFNAWQAEGHWCTPGFPSSLFTAMRKSRWEFITERQRPWHPEAFCPESTHLREWSVEATVVAVALDPDGSQTGKLASVVQTSKPPGSDSAVALARADVYWSYFQSPT